MKKIPVKLGAASYDVLMAKGVLRNAGRLITATVRSRPSSCVVVTSPRVQRLWGKQLTTSLSSAKLAFSFIEIPDGERHKNMQTVEKVMMAMTKAGADRKSIVIAFGGGVVGDVAGFAASIYMRGIPVIQIPTTLLAQVDASIGGKTGVNLSAGKNLVGTFHQPKLVIIDPEVLSTLPVRDFRAGLFEVIKCGVIRDARLFRILEAKNSAVVKRDSAVLGKVVEASVRVKADVVSKDEREGGLRRILNFGHTIGHALEADGDYKRLLHGEAVAWGMIAAAKIGVAMGVTPVKVSERIIDLALRYGPLPKISPSPVRILRLIKSDKKTLRGTPHFVLATSIGSTTVSDQVPASIIRRVVSELRTLRA